jgi:DNA-binding transcriptional regulator YiaG
MSTEQCSQCGASAPVIRGNYKFDEIGIPVMLVRARLVKCTECGNMDPIIPNLDRIMDYLALTVICKPYKLTGKEVRFLRKYTGKSQEEFAKRISVNPTTISKWENSQTEPGPQSDRLIRLLVVNLSERLEKTDKKIMELVFGEQEPTPERRPQLQLDIETMHSQYA